MSRFMLPSTARIVRFSVLMVLWAVLLAGGLFLLTPHTALAAEIPGQDPAIPATSPATSVDKEGCGCHSAELESWESSPHGMLTAEGKPAAACATCHGKYVEGHPDEGMIQLDVDSSACIDCHEQTGMEWDGTIHAEAGVQCISCHVSHTQDLRLDSDKLCESCHRDALEDPLHTAHWMAETSCTSCHLADGEPHLIGGSLASADPTAMLSATPSHDFVSVSTRNCLDCHRKDVTETGASTGARTDATYTASRALIDAAAEAPALRAELTTVQQANRTLAIWQPITLGAGISLGGVLGIAFVLAMVRMNRTRRGGDQ